MLTRKNSIGVLAMPAGQEYGVMDRDQVVVGIADLSGACLTDQDVPVQRVKGFSNLGSGEEQVRQPGARHRCLQV